MTTLSQMLSQGRKAKDITLETAARDLKISKEHLRALEDATWQDLPDPAFVRGFIKNYADYLDLDANYLLALYRREYDAEKHPKSIPFFKKQKRIISPNKVINLGLLILVIAFIAYLIIQYTSIAKSPVLTVISPPADETTTVPVVLIAGKTEKGATVSINGEFAPVDENGNFSTQLKLKDGQNIVEIIAAKRLSPKTKITRVIRLSS